MNGAVMDNVVF